MTSKYSVTGGIKNIYFNLSSVTSSVTAIQTTKFSIKLSCQSFRSELKGYIFDVADNI